VCFAVGVVVCVAACVAPVARKSGNAARVPDHRQNRLQKSTQPRILFNSGTIMWCDSVLQCVLLCVLQCVAKNYGQNCLQRSAQPRILFKSCTVAWCCNYIELQCVAARCSALQCVAVRCKVLQSTKSLACTADWCGIAVCCRALQCVTMCCSVLQRVAAC